MHQENGASAPLACPDCGQAYEPADNYCRECGMYLAAERLPVAKSGTGAVTVRPAGLPVPAKRVATAVAVGTALQIGAGAGRQVPRPARRQRSARERTQAFHEGRDEAGRGGTDRGGHGSPVRPPDLDPARIAPLSQIAAASLKRSMSSHV